MSIVVKNNILWVGQRDWEVRDFHGTEYKTLRGSSYNSYLIREEKNVLIDTVDHKFSREFVQNLRREIDLADLDYIVIGTVAKLAMRQPFVLFKGLTFQKLCLPGAFRPGDHHNKMLRPGLCVVHASPQYL